MLTLYSKETTSFSTLGIGVLRDFISHPLITEELNGAYTLEFEYAKDGYLSEYLIEQNIIKANGQAFRIWNIKKDMQKITVLAKHIFFDLSFNFLADVFPTNLTAQSALAWMLNRAAVATNFSATGNCTQTSSTRYVRKNFIDAVFNEDNALLKKFGGELSYDNFNITVHEHRGTNANFSIRYKKNLTGIDFNLDFSNIATRIVPIGFDGLTIDSTYVESPRASNYFTPLYKTYEFNDIKYDPDDEEAYHTLAEAKQALINAANELFTKNVDLPQVSIGVNFVELSKCSEYASYSNLETVYLGDTIDVIIPELNIHTSARVNKTVYDCILERFITLEIGSAKQSITRSQIVIENQIRKSENYLTQAQQNAENLINHPFNGNVLIDKENGVIYLMDSTSPATAQNVWKWSLGGLGFSSTGINGTYTVAILQDGRINADFITTGQLNTGVIQGYDSLLIQVDTLDREFQKEINPTDIANGSSISLEDSAEAELIDFELEGKTEQETSISPVMPSPDYPSELESVGYKNLLNPQWFTGATTNQVTLTNTNNKIVLGGTATAQTTFSTGLHNIPTNVSRITLSGGTSDVSVAIYFYNNNTYISGKRDSGSGISTLIPNNANKYAFDIRVANGTELDNYEVKAVLTSQINILPYIPYGKYGIEVINKGKNILPILDGTITYNGLTITIENGVVNINGTSNGSTFIKLSNGLEGADSMNSNWLSQDCLLDKNGKTFSLNYVSGTGATTGCAFRVFAETTTYINQYYPLDTLQTTTYTQSGKITNVIFYTQNNKTFNNYKFSLQIEKGNQATTYEPYQSNTQLYVLDEPLRAIGNYKDRLFIQDGVLYVERKIGSVILNGTENWSASAGSHFTLLKDIGLLAVGINNTGYLLSNYYQEVANNQTDNSNYNITRYYATPSYNYEKIVIRNTDITNGDIASFKTWLSTHNTEVIYVLATPTVENLGEVKIPSTYEGITYINTTDNLEPNMNIEYVRNTTLSNYVEGQVNRNQIIEERHYSELKLTEEGITSRVETTEIATDELSGRMNAVEIEQTSQQATINILGTNIDLTNGEVREVTTTTGFTFNAEGMTISDSDSNFRALHRKDGTYYYDGENVVGQYTKDGSKQKDLELFGVYTYGKASINSPSMFIAQLYTDSNGEVGMGHFYNGGE